jgi:hypothetical protein
MTTLKTTTYNNYNQAYNEMVALINNSTALNPKQKADCLEALATINDPAFTGYVDNTPYVPPSEQSINTNLA